ncbi:uncharacterized protein JN550_000831 [Neoarthrinium moseri]|uniref:uncharacterized protein n=1 Tax=Neoarthrinium moseri TaxID=1658444 RepID=UPI001FDD3217|nr:uncharacterized protein JN550_000831 [Neoarthrinium moseri]KAI1876759.1 hypothetical protein JN550_000831 [Neoarthrinium moseri]
MKSIRTWSYKSLRQSDNGTDPTDSTHREFPILYMHMGWIMASLFAFSTAYLLFQPPAVTNYRPTTSVGSFNAGFSTEFGPVKPHIEEESTMFWGGPRWYDNGTGYHLHNPSEPIYVGTPTPEIDAAWGKLLKGRYFNITEEEAAMTFGRAHGLYNHPDGVGYLIGLDIFHTLHCVDELRKALDRDHYFNKKTKQQLMCHADLTPIPVIWKWDAVRQFISSRAT